MDKAAQLLALGRQRVRLLECLGGDNPRASGYFNPGLNTDIFKAFADYVAMLSEQWATASYPTVISLMAAARLLTGDLTATEVILDHLPAKAPKLDHGAGFCVMMPFYAMSTALPLPAELTDTGRWLAGSAEEAALRAWVAEHRDVLTWVEVRGVYDLPATG